jgi:uncharacterized membrane protein YqjE
MNETASHANGWPDSFRRIRESLLALIHSRFELFAVELQEEKLRLINLLVWLGVAMALGTAGLLLGVGVLAVWLWNTAGYAGLIVLALATLAVGAGILLGIRRQVNSGPPPFAETVAEFKKDAECLRQS